MSVQNNIIVDDSEIILRLRLLIARAANKDSLRWWDDESLASHSAFLLRRIFPIDPMSAARNLALQAAQARHEAALIEPQALHLYGLDADNRDALAVRQTSVKEIQVPNDPISTTDELAGHLEQVTNGPHSFEVVRHMPGNGLLIRIPDPSSKISVWRHRAQSLAWAYLEGAAGQPVFPFVLE